MKNALLILLLLTPALFADKKPKRNVTVKDSSPTGIKTDVTGHWLIESSGIKTDVNGHLQVESNGTVTLTKKGQRASYNVVGASEKGTLLLGLDILGLDSKADEGAFKVQLARGAKTKFIHPQGDDEQFLTDLHEHLMVEPTGIKSTMHLHLLVQHIGIATVWADSWPPPKTDNDNDNEANVLIVEALNSGISSGKIKLKKPPLTPEQHAGRAKRLLVLRCKLRWFAGFFSPKEKPPTKSDR